MSATAGLWMLAALAIVLIVTGWPAWLSLIAVASGFAAVGVLTSAFPAALLGAFPARMLGLLENDLLQALPLYVFVGALLNHLALATILFRSGSYALRSTGGGTPLAGLSLGILLAPMSGSVGASIATLARTVLPRLRDAGMPLDQSTALICVTSTLGVVVPPSLVLILLADTLMRAHTEAINMTHSGAQIVNTQDVFIGALAPAGILLALYAVIAWRNSRSRTIVAPTPAPSQRDCSTACVAALLVLALLAAVSLGYLYPVEGAATGGVALLAYGIATRTLRRDVLRNVLYDTLAISGALFALLVGATTFTLVVRAFGTDVWIQTTLAQLHLAPRATLGIALASLALCALVLDAFEIIFVVAPILLPQVLVQIPDVTWVAVLTLLILQASFLMPPFGYAVLMTRNASRESVAQDRLARALMPYLAAQLAVLLLTLAWPGVLLRHPSPTALLEYRDRDTTPQTLEQQLERNAIDLPLPDDSSGDSTRK